MQPPETINVIDQHGGFTAITPYCKSFGALWRPGPVLKHGTIGKLQSFDEKSFWQNNNNVTQAIYKVKGYRYPVACWFDNETGERIA